MSEQTPTEQRITERIDKTVTSELAVRPTGALAATNVDQLMELAKMMAVAQVAVPKHLRGNPGACLAIAIQASEWEMSPFAVANKSYVVNDRISYEAQLINAVILRRAPIVGRFKVEYRGEDRTRRCKVWCNVRDPETGQLERVEYESPELGKIPVQNSPLWKGDPEQQLFYYSSRAMCRRHFPDVILGIYTPEEMAEAIDITATRIPEATIGKTIEAPKKESIAEKFLSDAQAARPPTDEKKPAPETVTEAAQQEAAKGDEKKPEQTQQAATKPPAEEKGPTAKELIAQIMKKARNEHSLSKSMMTLRLIDAKMLNADQTVDDLDAKTAANVLDAWDEIVKEDLPK